MAGFAESTTIDEAGASFNDAICADEDGWPPSDAANDDEGRPLLKDAGIPDDEGDWPPKIEAIAESTTIELCTPDSSPSGANPSK
jgi:hypothetical protein